MGIHGYPRYTGDLDIWIHPTFENASKLLIVITEFGMDSLNLTIKDLSTPGRFVQIGFPPLRIDLLTDIDGVKFEEAYAHKINYNNEGFIYDIINYDDLIKNKRASGRGKDIGDIENLQ